MSGTKPLIPVTLTAQLPCRGGRVLQVTLGDSKSENGARFVEFASVDAGRKARIEWGADSYRCRPVDERLFVASVSLDDAAPTKVLVRPGVLLAIKDEDKSTEPFMPDELGWLGDLTLDLESTTFAGISPPGLRTVFAASNGGGGAPGTVGCLADFTGAGAGLVGAAGAVVGSAGGVPGAVAGATTGAVVGGAAGAAVGVGYCVVGPALDGVWDWLFG
jgi:hypothetical protein